jgi:hypothetical protein
LRSYNQFGEDNDTCAGAFPITINSPGQFLAEDLHDWYRTTLFEGGSLTITLTNFVPLAGQLAVYRGEICAAAVFLASNGSTAATKVLSLGPQPAGTYYVYVSNDGPPNSSDLYTLLVASP